MPTGAYVPSRQVKQALAPLALMVPLEQALQVVVPAMEEYLPVSQSWHSSKSLYLPGKQAVQANTVCAPV